jgi:hypothetical protein
MLEVCERFRMTISEYQTLPVGERALYNQYVVLKHEEAMKAPVCPFLKKA